MASTFDVDVRDPVQVHEAVVENRLQTLRDEFWVLRVDPPNVECPKTGERNAPASVPLCPNCSRDVDGGSLLYGEVNDDAHFCCDDCFDDAHRPEIEAQLARENERDY